MRGKEGETFWDEQELIICIFKTYLNLLKFGSSFQKNQARWSKCPNLRTTCTQVSAGRESGHRMVRCCFLHFQDPLADDSDGSPAYQSEGEERTWSVL